ncbi:MAG: TraR/DksA C4-type zinc finger protein [Desulfuromonadaceae bacterium]
MDEIDLAQPTGDAWLAECLRTQLAKTAPLPTSPRWGEELGPLTQRGRVREGEVDCIDCDNPIPPARLAVQPNAERCVQCQTDFETRRHM